MKKIKVIIIIGTRPEFIKCYPIIHELRNDERFDLKIIFSGQHKELLDMMIEDFHLSDFVNLNIFDKTQTLSSITYNALKALEDLNFTDADYCIVQGDTTTVFVGALWAFYHNIKVCHVEAGLRSGNLYSPFPEEANRKLTGVITDIHFAPTEKAKENLLKEGILEDNIFVTGNTVIDTIRLQIKDNYNFKCKILNDIVDEKNILLTAHRRENQSRLEDIFTAVRDCAERYNHNIIFPMHPSPKVREMAQKYLADRKNVFLIDPLCYHDMIHLMKCVNVVVTDSGGLQEEAPYFGKPVLVIRDETERPEGIEAGTAILIGTNKENIYNKLSEVLQEKELYLAMKKAISPYGDGYASERIKEILIKRSN